MIQRKQTLFLLAVTIIATTLLFLPFYALPKELGNYSLTLLTATGNIDNAYYLMVLNNMVILLSIITIFLYNKRTVQFKLANLLVVFNIFITGLAYLLQFKSEENLIKVSYGAFLPLLAAVFSYLAAYYIKKDELLVRNSNRIR